MRWGKTGDVKTSAAGRLPLCRLLLLKLVGVLLNPCPAFIIRDTIQDVILKTAKALERVSADTVALEVTDALTLDSVVRRRAKGASRRRPRVELTKWVADNRARRVPNFVIQMTGGLDTKKKIVAKFGPNVVFEKGKPLPKSAKSA